MPIKRPQLVNGEIYHIVIRSVDGLELFKNRKDYLRMIYNLFEFNNENPARSTYRHNFNFNIPRTVLSMFDKNKIILVEILAFCLMPNHVHLLARQVQEGGITKFMRKIGAGYAMYYNKKYERKGHVFQGRYRIVHIKTQEQLKTVFVYIHTNPVSFIVPNWKEKGIKSEELQKVIRFLENYQWSSYQNYLGKSDYSFLTNIDFLTKIMGGIDGCRNFINNWLQFKKELADINKIGIE
ncbi:MAG: transposase [Candidatus Pacebacteria bacterium]|nr:transposase [Candidatus Paceibacterota bacterium]